MVISSLGLCTCLLPAMSRALQAFQTRSEANDFFCGLQLEDWALFTLDHVLNDLLQVLGVFLTAAYMVVKGRIFMRALKLWRAAFYKLLQSTR